MDRLLAQGIAAHDPAKRTQIYDQFQALFADHLPVLIPSYPHARTAVSMRTQTVLTDQAGGGQPVWARSRSVTAVSCPSARDASGARHRRVR